MQLSPTPHRPLRQSIWLKHVYARDGKRSGYKQKCGAAGISMSGGAAHWVQFVLWKKGAGMVQVDGAAVQSWADSLACASSWLCECLMRLPSLRVCNWTDFSTY
jgi:hypothetical protein